MARSKLAERPGACRPQGSALARLALVAALGLAVTGCSTVKDVFSSGGDKEELAGERISVLTLEQRLEVDPRIADMEVRLPAPYNNEDWPQPGGFASHAMYHLALAENLEIVWRRSVGSGADSVTRIIAPPVIAGGRVFVLDATAHVGALDAASGERLWRTSLVMKKEKKKAGFGGGVAFEDGRVIVTTGFGRIHALDAATGQELWVRSMGIPFHAAPTINGGRVFAVTHDNELHVLAADDGRMLWTHQGITEQAGLLTNSSPAVAGEVVVVPYSSGELYAFRVQNGRMAWADSLTRTGRLTSMSTINDIAGRPVIDRDRVIAISHSGRLVSIDLRSGERVWTRDISGIQTPWVAGDFVFVLTTEEELLCIAAADGRIRWISQLPRYRKEKKKKDPVVWSGPVLAGNRLILVSSQGRAVSVSPYSGDILGQIKIPDGTLVPPVVADGTLYILTEDADLLALR